MPVIMGVAKYPENILSELASKCHLVSLDALELARQAGSLRSVNIVLMGAMAHGMKLCARVVDTCDNRLRAAQDAGGQPARVRPGLEQRGLIGMRPRADDAT